MIMDLKDGFVRSKYFYAFFSSHYVHRKKVRTFSLFSLSNDLMNTPIMKFLHRLTFRDFEI